MTMFETIIAPIIFGIVFAFAFSAFMFDH